MSTLSSSAFSTLCSLRELYLIPPLRGRMGGDYSYHTFIGKAVVAFISGYQVVKQLHVYQRSSLL